MNTNHILIIFAIITLLFSFTAFGHVAGKYSKLGNGNKWWDNDEGIVVKPCPNYRGGDICTNCHTKALEKTPDSLFHPLLEDFYWDYSSKRMVKACAHHVEKKDCEACHK